MKSLGIAPDCLEYLHRIKTSSMKLSNVERKSVKPEEMQQLSCIENLEKALPHQPLLPPFLVFTAQDPSVHRLVSLATCALTDTFLNHKVDQMVLINYNGQRRRRGLRSEKHVKFIGECILVKSMFTNELNMGLPQQA